MATQEVNTPPTNEEQAPEWLVRSENCQRAVSDCSRRLRRLERAGTSTTDIEAAKQKQVDALRAQEDAQRESRQQLHGGFPYMCSSREIKGFVMYLHDNPCWAVDVCGDHAEVDQAVYLWTRYGHTAQRFRYDPATGHIMFARCPELVIGVTACQSGGSLRLERRDHEGAGRQRWRYDEETCHVIHASTGLAMDLHENVRQNGRALQLHEAKRGEPAQMWRLAPVQ